MPGNLYKTIFFCLVLYTGLTTIVLAETSISKGCRFLLSNPGIDACQEAIDAHGDVGSYQRLASLLEKANRIPEAIEVYKKGLQQYPNDSLMDQRYKLLLSNIEEQENSPNAVSIKIEEARSLKYSCLSLPRNMSLTLKKCESALQYQKNDPEILAVISQIKSGSSTKPSQSTQTTQTAAEQYTSSSPAKPKATAQKSTQQKSYQQASKKLAPNAKQNTHDISDNRKRFALVIGNSAYKSVTRLKNPVNDATDVAKKLKSLGFKVTLKKNTTRKQMLAAIRKFGDTLYKNTKSVGLFYYAGHGVQVNGKNYFIPVSSNVQAVPDLEYENVGMDRLVDYIAYAGNELNFFIIDACRDNPYRKMPSLARRLGNTPGLASNINVPTGTMYFYAAKPGQRAADGSKNARNSPFTSALIKHLGNSDLSIEQIFKRVAIEVHEQTNKTQHPWSEGIITSEFYPGK